MSRTPGRLICVFAAALSVAALAACGEKEEPTIVGPPPVVNPGTGEAPAPIGNGQGGVALEQIGVYDSPVYVTQPRRGDRGIYIVEQKGRVIRQLPDGSRKVFLDISDRVSCCGEQGLLSMAFAPDFASSGLFYVSYTDKRGDSRVLEYGLAEKTVGKGKDRETVTTREAAPASARGVLWVKQPFANHNGGLIVFGPDDNLYVGLGDGGSAGDPDRNGQDLGTLLGKILRIDPEQDGDNPYSVPPSNPFTGNDAARPEVVVYGVRNPWRFSFDGKGSLWIGDVGQGTAEEVNYVASPEGGANLGWSAFEGETPVNEDQDAQNPLPPVFSYGHDVGCSITGGYVVRDRALPTLFGRYLYADFCQGQLRSFGADEALPGPVADDVALGLQVPSISSFGEDADGHIYATSLEGAVYRLIPGGSS